MPSDSPNNYYPKSPNVNRKELLHPGSVYKRRISMVLLGLLAFWSVFFGLILFNVWLLYLLLLAEFSLFLQLGAIAMVSMFLIFLLKFLFKKNKALDDGMLEISEADAPELFQFLRQLSAEVGAPFPKRVYVNHEINAKVFYKHPLRSLFLPTRKNLLIGLGLVNSLNLTEFKAVLAHEFGHFSQGSMRLGSYVYMANRIIYDMVYSRDKWDQYLVQWRASDFRIAIFAWMLTPFISLVRLLMQAMYKSLNLLQSSLSRQMEFHADRYAVSAAGSEAIVHALYKLGPANEAFHFTIEQLRAAIDHQLFSDNIFYHHKELMLHLEETDPEFKSKLLKNITHPEDRSKIYLFEKSDAAMIDMYASHPPNYERESNAKKVFVEGPRDQRSAWILFGKEASIAEAVTKKTFIHQLKLPKKSSFHPAEEVQEFIDNELKEISFDPKYANYYGNSYLNQVNKIWLKNFPKQSGITTKPALIEALAALFDDEFLNYWKEVQEIEENHLALMALAEKHKNSNLVKYKGKTYDAPSLKKAIENYQDHRNKVNKFRLEKDRQVLGLHYLALEYLNQPYTTLLNAYDFQWTIQQVHFRLSNINRSFEGQIKVLIQRQSRMREQDVLQFAENFGNISKQLQDVINYVATLEVPELNGMENLENLAHYIANSEVPNFSAVQLSQEKILALEALLKTTINRTYRIIKKHIGYILQVQEHIEETLKSSSE